MATHTPKRNRNYRKVGKAEAREQLPRLVDAVASGNGPIEITDYGKVVALLVDPQEYAWLISQAQQQPKPKFKLRGSATLHGDLEEASREISESIRRSIEKTASEL